MELAVPTSEPDTHNNYLTLMEDTDNNSDLTFLYFKNKCTTCSWEKGSDAAGEDGRFVIHTSNNIYHVKLVLPPL